MVKLLFILIFIPFNYAFSYEVDDFYCTKYFKIKKNSSLTKEVNTYTRSKLTDAVNAINVWIKTQPNNTKCCQSDCIKKSGSYKKLYKAINKRLGNGAHTIIEQDLKSKYSSKLCVPSKDESICKGVEPAGFGAQGALIKWADKLMSLVSQDNLRIGESVNICGQTIGTDKLGHFFDSGLQMLSYHTKVGRNLNYAISETLKAQEGGSYGVGTTGVYSFADYVANSYGQSFYLDLIGPNQMIDCDDSSGVIQYKIKKQFDWCNYVHEAWNESKNCSAYSYKQISQVQANKADKDYSCPKNKAEDKLLCDKMEKRLMKDFSANSAAINKTLNCGELRLTTYELGFLDEYRKD